METTTGRQCYHNSFWGDHFRLADLTVVIEPSELVAFHHYDLSATFQGVDTRV